MNSFQDYLVHGQGWLFIPAAILLGALHGLEPGHSKTMMAAFIISIRGTVTQAVLLGLSAAFSHTLIIWVLAAIELHYAGQLNVEGLEPWFQFGAGVIIIGMTFWMFLRIRNEQSAAHHHHGNSHDHGPHGGTMLDTGHGLVEISVFETDVPPRFRLYFFDGQAKAVKPSTHEQVTIETIRPDGTRETFKFKAADDYLETTTELPEPHEFTAKIVIAHGNHAHTYETQFTEDHHHHDSAQGASEEYQDAHERAHAQELQTRFAGRTVTTGQIVLFGLTGGLMPCPAAFSILLVCLQIKQFVLGFTLVLAFSVGLAITLVTVGTVAAMSINAASKRFAGFGELARRLPYASVGLMGLIGLTLMILGLKHLLK